MSAHGPADLHFGKTKKMRVVKVIGRYNYNTGGVPGHISGRRADPIPIGAVVDVEQRKIHCGTLTKVRWYPGVDSYGNTFVETDLGLAGDKYLTPIKEGAQP